MHPGKRRGPALQPGPSSTVPLQKVKRSVAHGRDGKPRLPDCMLCVLDHLAAGLAPGPRALLICYGRHAHDAGCGIYPGLRSLSAELRTSPVTLREWRDELQKQRLIERLPRKGPHGADLIRLGRCDACRQRDSMQSRCRACQRDSLQHAETEWWTAQRDYMESQKRRELQAVPAKSTTRQRTQAAGELPAVVKAATPGRSGGQVERITRGQAMTRRDSSGMRWPPAPLTAVNDQARRPGRMRA
jgi:hypothetical protein